MTWVHKMSNKGFTITRQCCIFKSMVYEIRFVMKYSLWRIHLFVFNVKKMCSMHGQINNILRIESKSIFKFIYGWTNISVLNMMMINEIFRLTFTWWSKIVFYPKLYVVLSIIYIKRLLSCKILVFPLTNQAWDVLAYS